MTKSDLNIRSKVHWQEMSLRLGKLSGLRRHFKTKQRTKLERSKKR